MCLERRRKKVGFFFVFFFAKNSAVHAMPPAERKGYNDHIKRNLKYGLESSQPHV